MEKTDVQLVSESVLGNQASFEALVHRYTDSIYGFCLRRTGDVTAAEDCTQETFMKCWKHLGSFNESQASFKTWLFTIARNSITDHLRKKTPLSFSRIFSRNSSGEHDDSLEETIPDESRESATEEFVITQEAAAHLSRHLLHLPENYQTVLTLHYQEGLTFQEIGTVMNRPLNTVKSWHRRAQQLLKTRIEQEP